MADRHIDQRLAAILAADVAGYSRLMEADERATVATLDAYRTIFHEHVTAHGGRIVDTAGDSVLAVFLSAIGAVEAALAIQDELRDRNERLPEDQRMRFRLGVNLGDVIEKDDGSVYGSGVNVAARLESLAEPGGVTISEDIFHQIEGKIDLSFQDIGEHEVKNIARPVRAYCVSIDSTGVETPTGADKPLPLPDKPSIAVLAFDNLSGDPEQEYFADGIAEDLITALSRIRWLFVAARNSTFTYKGRSTDVKKVGRDLGVRYVVEGSVRRGGQRVRITVQLIDATTGNHLWAERYDRTLEDIFAVQDEISETIVAAIEPELAAVEREKASHKPPQSLDAWETCQRGMWHLYRFTAEDNLEARKLFRVTIAKYPKYGAAHAGLAYGQFLAFIIDYPDPDLDEALHAGRQANLIDDRDAMAHFALGRVYAALAKLGDAADELREAIEINPSMAIAHYALGYVCMLRGEPELACREIDIAERLSPRDPLLWAFEGMRADARAFMGDLDSALVDARRSSRRPNADFWAPMRVAVLSAHLGNEAEARSALEELLRQKPTFTIELALQRLGYSDPAQVEFLTTGLAKAGLGIPDEPAVAD